MKAMAEVNACSFGVMKLNAFSEWIERRQTNGPTLLT